VSCEFENEKVKQKRCLLFVSCAFVRPQGKHEHLVKVKNLQRNDERGPRNDAHASHPDDSMCSSQSVMCSIRSREKGVRKKE
jgi:hypothetical protein